MSGRPRRECDEYLQWWNQQEHRSPGHDKRKSSPLPDVHSRRGQEEIANGKEDGDGKSGWCAPRLADEFYHCNGATERVGWNLVRMNNNTEPQTQHAST